MKQIILIIAVLMSSLAIGAQQKITVRDNEKEKASLASAENKQSENLHISETALELNNQGVEKSLKERDFEGAILLFQKAIESDSGCLECRYNLGTALIHRGKYSEAIKIFTDLTLLKPDYANAFAGLGEAYGKKGFKEESASAYIKAAELAPNDITVLSNLGDALHQIKKYEKSLNYLDKAIKLNPDFAALHNNRGNTLFALGRYKEAIESLQRAIALKPDSAEAQTSLGAALSVVGKEKEAHKHYLEAVRLQPNWDTGLYNLALSNLKLGNRNIARQQLSALQSIDSTLASELKKVIFGKYIIDVSKIK